MGLLGFLIGAPGLLFATPEVAGFTGTFSNGANIVIEGRSFGSKTQASPLTWDTLESGRFSADWASTHDLGIVSNEVRHIRSRQTAHLNFTNNQNEGKLQAGSQVYRKWFAQYWFRVSPNWDWGTSTYGGPNTFLANIKVFRLWNPGSTTENFVLAFNGWDNIIRWDVENVSPEQTGVALPDAISKMTKGSWHLIQFEFEENSAPDRSDGKFRMWFDGKLTSNESRIKTRQREAGYKRPFLIGFSEVWGGNDKAPNDFYMDDIYMDSSWARVEIGDQSIYGNCSKREIQIPTRWNDNQIQVQVNSGGFNVGETVYLFVVNDQGEISNPGLPLVVGGDSASVPLPPLPPHPAPTPVPTPTPDPAPISSPAPSPVPPGNTSVSGTEASTNIVRPYQNQEAELAFTLDQQTTVIVQIFNRSREKIIELFYGTLPAGRHVLSWDGRNSEGALVASGVYHARIQMGEKIEKRKIVVVK
ncbi:MAG: hypothetical protein KCHDKBKB_01497 [Elusimicrobia bacterium]|nr:hypothetical protein [Elusimicrobiota bacterium]